MRLAAFTGTWEIERIIEDMRDGHTGRFSGQAVFRPAGEALEYSEQGTLILGPGPAMAARRDYRWIEARPGEIEVHFADGRFFHRFSGDDPMPEAVHSCLPDHYTVRYDFRRWPLWTAEWRARGPRKDYVMVSDYRPAGQGPGIES